MEVFVRAAHNLGSEALRGHIEQRFRSVLARLASSIRRVEVRVDDVNGPRGGPDKECSALVAIKGEQPLNFKVNAGDAYHAVDLLASLVKHSLVRHRKATQSKRRRQPRFAVEAAG